MKTEITDISNLPIVLTVDNISCILRIGRVQAYNLAHSEGFPLIKSGRRLIIPRDAFLKWLNLQPFEHPGIVQGTTV